jgi:hypothetical protein
MAVKIREAGNGAHDRPMALHIILYSPPGPGRFVEVEDDQGDAVACRRRECETGI